MDDKRITLLISTYNWKDALRLCLLSASLQTVMPDEIVIADDGSTEDTKLLIDTFRKVINVPIIHVWQEDDGFRLSTIRNKAIAQSTGDYIIQIDGDVIMERHFIEDHINMSQEGYFVCGSRTKIGPMVTNRLITDISLKINILEYKPAFVLNGIRSKLLRTYLAERYAKEIGHMRGCNMAFWRNDIISVNGYNENLKQWGHEDSEMAYRLHFSGVKKKALKMGGIVYHLWHSESSRLGEQMHIDALNLVKSRQLRRCENGINNYLQ